MVLITTSGLLLKQDFLDPISQLAILLHTHN